MIGAFVVAYGLFETRLERALWALQEQSVKGVRPFTEKMNSESQFKMLAEGNAKLSAKCNEVLRIAALAAEDLNEYRNSLVHGYLLSFGAGSTPSFLKNPAWDGEQRKKATGDAYINEPFQDLVLIAAWTLFGLVRAHIAMTFERRPFPVGISLGCTVIAHLSPPTPSLTRCGEAEFDTSAQSSAPPS